MRSEPLYRALAQLMRSVRNCQESDEIMRDSDGNAWEDVHVIKACDLAEAYLPSGSGFDSGSLIDEIKSRPDRLVLQTAFHHMTEHGMYDGWTEHEVIVTPSLEDQFNLRVTGKNRNNIKSYIHEIFGHALRDEVEF